MRKLRSAVALFATLSLLAAIIPAQVLAASPEGSGSDANAIAVKASPNGIYIVSMAGDPVVAYEGGIKNLRATAPKPGAKIDPFASDVTSYVAYLKSTHDAALKSVGAGGKIYDYVYSNNAFAAKLTDRKSVV